MKVGVTSVNKENQIGTLSRKSCTTLSALQRSRYFGRDGNSQSSHSPQCTPGLLPMIFPREVSVDCGGDSEVNAASNVAGSLVLFTYLGKCNT